MPTQNDIAQQQQLLATYGRNLAHELDRAAQYGGEARAPVELRIALECTAISTTRAICATASAMRPPSHLRDDDADANPAGAARAGRLGPKDEGATYVERNP